MLYSLLRLHGEEIKFGEKQPSDLLALNPRNLVPRRPKCLFRHLKQGLKDFYFVQPHHLPASVAQLDARPTGDQEVAGSTPGGNILS